VTESESSTRTCDTTRAFVDLQNTKAPEGTADGVTLGGVMGSTIGRSTRH
jgi:outer membrane lipoprotein SlyB